MRLGVLLGILLVMVAPRARAGCPNVCDLTVGGATVEPALPCLTVQATAETCNCGVFLTVTNGCSTNLDATPFQFDGCGAPGAAPTAHQCSTLAAAEQGTSLLAVSASSGTGAKSWTLPFEEYLLKETLTVQANVTSFGAGCACSVPARGETPGGALALVLAGVSITAARRRRRP